MRFERGRKKNVLNPYLYLKLIALYWQLMDDLN